MLVDRIVQFSPLVRDLDTTLDAVHTFLGAFPSRRNKLDVTGVDIAIYPFGDETFMELIAPYDPSMAPARLLNRTGEGWFMLNADIVDDQPVEEIDREIRATGVRVARGGVHEDGKSGAWHLHPQDAGGVLLALYVRQDRPDHTDWAGLTWKHFVETNRRVVDSIIGVSLATRDLSTTASLYHSLGFRFADEFEDGGEKVLQASLPGGTFLQLRTPIDTGGALSRWLDARGPGLYHYAFQVADLARATDALARVEGREIRRAEYEGREALWAEAPRVFGMPLEFRSAPVG